MIKIFTEPYYLIENSVNTWSNFGSTNYPSLEL